MISFFLSMVLPSSRKREVTSHIKPSLAPYGAGLVCQINDII